MQQVCTERPLMAQEQARIYLDGRFVGLGKEDGGMLRFLCLLPAGEI